MIRPYSVHSLMVEGNIGAGKSTFLRVIGKQLNVQVIYEPDKKWQNLGGGENLLEKFYTDTKRWAYTFQTYAFVSRVVEQEAHARANPGSVQLLERSVFADRYCFARNCFEMGVMSPLEWQLYKEWFTWLVDTYTIKPAGFIYLRTDPEVCYERVRKRSRAAEKGVGLDYLKLLHEKHEDWLVHHKDLTPFLQGVPILVLDCNEDFEYHSKEQQRHLQRVIDFFSMVSPKKSQPRPQLSALSY